MVTRLPASKQRETLEKWLKRHGFTGNPFAEREAGREKRLSEYFVEGPYYDEIKGSADDPRTCFVFAGRGCGKSAYRVMLQQESRPFKSDGVLKSVLAVPYMDFSPFLEVGEGKPGAVTLPQHVTQILGITLRTLFCELCKRPEPFMRLVVEEQGRFKKLSKDYASDLLQPEQLLARLKESEPKWKLNRDLLSQAISQGRLSSLLMQEEVWENPTVRFLAAFADSPTIEPVGPQSMLEHFRQFVVLVRKLGMKAVYVLVDRLDEWPQTNRNPEACVAFLTPLVSYLPLMELHHLAFKFFLPLEAFPVMRKESVPRFDRLQAYELQWTDADLLHMLRQRLEAFSNKKVQSLGQLADESINKSIDMNLVSKAYGSPRNLLLLGEYLFTNHCARAKKDELLLAKKDLDLALKQYIQEVGPLAPPPGAILSLRIDERQKIFFGDVEFPVHLSREEYDLLKYLYQYKGQVRSKDDIYFGVLQPLYRERLRKQSSRATEGQDEPEAVEQAELKMADDAVAAIESLVHRLRKKIEPNPRRPVYVVTVRGQGYRLEHAV